MQRLREGGVNLKIHDLVDELLRLNNADKLHDNVTVSEYAEFYIEDKLRDYTDKSRTKEKIRRYENSARNHLKQFIDKFGSKRLSEITPEDIKRFYGKRKEKINVVHSERS